MRHKNRLFRLARRKNVKLFYLSVLLVCLGCMQTGKLFAKTVYPTPLSPIKQFVLDNLNEYTIKVPQNRGVTTVMFPSAISGIYSGDIATDKSTERAKQVAQFLLSYSPGSYYFSLAALQDAAKGELNVVFDRKIYVIHLVTAEPQKAYSSVTFVNSTDVAQKKSIGPVILKSILDKAENYTLYAKYYPDSVSGCQYVSYEKVFNYGSYDIKLMGVYRFDSADTLVFHIVFHNNTNDELRYTPKDMAVRLGGKIYFGSIADASGVIPPRSQTQAYFGITGTSDGGKNDLAANNEWKVLIKAKKTNKQIQEVTPTDQLREQQIELTSKADYLNGLLAKPNLPEKDFEKIKKEAIGVMKQYGELGNQIKQLSKKHELKRKGKLWTGGFYIPKSAVNTQQQ